MDEVAGVRCCFHGLGYCIPTTADTVIFEPDEYQMKKVIFYCLAPVVLLVASCSGEEGHHVQTQPDAVEANLPENNTASHMHATKVADQETNAGIPALAEGGLPKELVCMVNNAYMGKDQFLVEFEGKQYYGCCEMCVKTIQNERQVRVALDPFTGKEIDKANAFIALKPGSNSDVLYFETEENYRKFID
ncbi:hypothetical protein Q4E40_13060 [Pontibacter sp. BT731]|uniref:hypothetical protein n=1 Tax=Pontibacter coccineus TaxID=3063328 RepID=UPI0026E242CB|nr:hypothetical protein [Pontibacter sp. BT731]MDO6391065.1 hypothetical protein [Pontibacter sp. BT731]